MLRVRVCIQHMLHIQRPLDLYVPIYNICQSVSYIMANRKLRFIDSIFDFYKQLFTILLLVAFGMLGILILQLLFHYNKTFYSIFSCSVLLQAAQVYTSRVLKINILFQTTTKYISRFRSGSKPAILAILIFHRKNRFNNFQRRIEIKVIVILRSSNFQRIFGYCLRINYIL